MRSVCGEAISIAIESNEYSSHLKRHENINIYLEMAAHQQKENENNPQEAYVM